MQRSAKALIAELSPTAPDADVAKLVALYLLENERVPYWFSIPHDIGPPAFRACPVQFDWAQKKRVGIKTNIKPKAEAWIIKAALAAFEISRDNGTPLTMSIARARREAMWAQRPDDDEDIPF
jgi:hypothetical protein